MIRNYFLVLMSLWGVTVKAQNYHAIQGSPYAGGLGIHNNPASRLMSPFQWDLTLIGVQAKSSTNVFTIYNYSLLSNPAKSQYQLKGGDMKRFGALSVNLNLLNAAFALNRRTVIAFGANVKSVTNLSSSKYNFIDTLGNTGDFFRINNPGNTYKARITSASWVEIYAGYSHTLIDDEAKRINAGITVKVNKGLSGARGELHEGAFRRLANNLYNISGGAVEYRYSSNYDRWKKNNSTSENLHEFIQYTEGGISFDAGFEYVIKPYVARVFKDEDDYYDYDWKIGLSLLDAGYTQYRYGLQSRYATSPKTSITNQQLDSKFDSTITSMAIFNDSAATVVDNFTAISGVFKIINPMRIVLNIDRFIYRNIYINADISINMPASLLKKWYSVHEMNLLTITPRWETSRYGFYLPIQVTNTKRFWIGGAFKAGPLLFGIHNWANLFTKNTIQNGGGYIALIIRNLAAIPKKYDRRLDCPAF